MKTKILMTVLALSLASCGEPKAAQQLSGVFDEVSTAPHYETITKVKDGDTVEIDARWNPYPGLHWSVRILGIDTPEKGHLAKCTRERELSAKAQALTQSLVRETGNRVHLTEVGHDKYGGRLDANVIMTDGRSIGDELIRAGLAKRYNGNGPKPNWCY